MPARMAIMAMTTSNSIKVNPFRGDDLERSSFIMFLRGKGMLIFKGEQGKDYFLTVCNVVQKGDMKISSTALFSFLKSTW